jgi:hypothetical protein
MIEFLIQVLEIAHPGAVLSAIVLGLIIGGAYGYTLSAAEPPHLPTQLWLTGITFIITFAALAYLTGEHRETFSFPGQAARMILWTFVCISIPIGRVGRYIWTARWMHRRNRNFRRREGRKDGP